MIVFFIGKWTGLIHVQNWWAIIFWIPAISSFGNVLKEIRLKNGLTFALISGISGIVFPITISIGFFLNANWYLFAPIFVIVSGLILFQTGFINANEPVGNFVAKVRPWIFSIGIAVILSGFILLFPTIKIEVSAQQTTNWFGIPFILCSFGGLFYLFQRWGRQNSSIFFMVINLITTIIFLMAGILTLLNFKLNLSVGAGFLFLFLAILLFWLRSIRKPT